MRDQFREYLSDTKAIAFVVDASTVSRNGAAVAEYAQALCSLLLTMTIFAGTSIRFCMY
jgi:signal recognition particle receptor subunit beta